jgi:hypothetical protein
LHFASRLYADLHHDELTPRRTDVLAMLRSIGMTKDDSRPILLERHVKDYLAMEYGGLNMFVTAVVEGLTSNTNPKDGELALYLARRLLQGRAIPVRAAEMIIRRLGSSPDPQHQQQCRDILLSLSPSPETARLFDHLLALTINRRGEGTSRDQALAIIGGIYRNMTAQGLKVTPRTRSILVRALVDAKLVLSALSVFNFSADEGIVLKSNAVGSLMVSLAEGGHLDYAEGVERRWRELAKGKHYHRGIVGARVLIDTMKGEDVNLETVFDRTGWRGTMPFLRFIESVKGQRASAQTATVGAAENAATLISPLPAPELSPRASGPGEASSQTTTTTTTPPLPPPPPIIVPPTRSSCTADGEDAGEGDVVPADGKGLPVPPQGRMVAGGGHAGDVFDRRLGMIGG